MELKEILAISGQPGLYKYVAQSKNGVIVESLLDGRRMNAAANAKVSALKRRRNNPDASESWTRRRRCWPWWPTTT